jgi:hypothetical protein
LWKGAAAPLFLFVAFARYPGGQGKSSHQWLFSSTKARLVGVLPGNPND